MKGSRGGQLLADMDSLAIFRRLPDGWDTATVGNFLLKESSAHRASNHYSCRLAHDKFGETTGWCDVRESPA